MRPVTHNIQTTGGDGADALVIAAARAGLSNDDGVSRMRGLVGQNPRWCDREWCDVGNRLPFPDVQPDAGSPILLTDGLSNTLDQRGSAGAFRPVWSARDRWIALAVVAVGAVFRVRNYLHCPSLWQDEASLSLNLRARTFAGLLRPLDFDQGAPLGFLMLVKGVISVLGIGELSLRLVPLAAGIGVLFLGLAVARRTLSPWGGLLFLAMLGVSQTLVQYAVQVKQYSLDTAICLALVLPALEFRQRGGRRSLVVWWAVLAAVAVWFSHPAVFVLGATVLTIGCDSLRRHRRREAIGVGIVGFAGGASFLANYLLFDRALVHNAFLQAFWKEGYMPRDSVVHAVAWVGRAIGGMCQLPLGNRTGLAVGLGIGLGATALIRRGRGWLLGLMVGPMGLAFVAAVAGKYPFQWRLLSFLVPALLLLCAVAVEWVWTAFPRAWRWAGPVLAVILLGVSTVKTAATLVHPLEVQQIQPVLAYIQGHRDPGEPVCYVNDAQTPFLYYARQYGMSPDAGLMARDAAAAAAVMRPLHGRVWLVLVNLQTGTLYRDKPILEECRSRGRLIDQVERAGVQAFEFDLRPPGKAN